MWKQLCQGFEHELYTCPVGVSSTKLCLSPNDKYLVCGSQNGAVIVLDVAGVQSGGGFEISEAYEDEHRFPVIGAEWTPNKSSFTTIDRAGGLYLWQA